MKTLVYVIALAFSIGPALAESSFSPSFYDELNQLGLSEEGFTYAIQWVGRGSSNAEVLVAYSLIDGTGTAPDPMAAISFVCGDRSMSAFEIEKVIIKANLRLIGSGTPETDCAAFAD